MTHENTQKKSLVLLSERDREQVEAMLRQNPVVWRKFQQLTEKLQEELMSFAMGNCGLKISYDPFFKMVFNPEIHRERLSRMLSCIMGQRVIVKRALPNESNRITAEDSLLIMDVLTELESGELVNVEIQKIGYAFPGERAACYSSDLLLRQYSRVKGRAGRRFSYRELRNVYTIVLIEKSSLEFHRTQEQYIHYSNQVFNTGLELNLLQKYIFISLDVFQEMSYTLNRELDAWLLFLSSDKPDDMIRIIEKYPCFKELYREIAEFQTKPEELVNMYSDALEIMDKNTVQYMIDEQQQEIERQRKLVAEKEELLQKQSAEIARLKKQLERNSSDRSAHLLR